MIAVVLWIVWVLVFPPLTTAAPLVEQLRLASRGFGVKATIFEAVAVTPLLRPAMECATLFCPFFVTLPVLRWAGLLHFRAPTTMQLALKDRAPLPLPLGSDATTKPRLGGIGLVPLPPVVPKPSRFSGIMFWLKALVTPRRRGVRQDS